MRRPGSSGLWVDLGDLRSLQTERCHQPFLVEERGGDVVLERRGRERASFFLLITTSLASW
jgi:hypothetical protein